jgi:hypothetical protein
MAFERALLVLEVIQRRHILVAGFEVCIPSFKYMFSQVQLGLFPHVVALERVAFLFNVKSGDFRKPP